MAVPGGTFQTYQAVGNREDLADIIFDISPMERPFFSNIGRSTASSTKVEWQTDALAAAVATNAHIEGDDATVNTAVPTVRFDNICQIATKVPSTAGTQRAMDSAGRSDEHDYQIMKRGRELALDIEKTILGTQLATVGAAASARVCAGLQGYLYANFVGLGTSSSAASLASGGHPSAAWDAGSASAFTEGAMKSAIALAWTAGGSPTLVLMDAFNKQAASAFTGIATQYRENPQQGPGTIIGAMDWYVSDFGAHALVASRHIPTDVVYGVDPEFVDVAFLREMEEEPLAKTGDSDKTLLLSEFTLRVLEPDAHFVIARTT